MKITPTAIPDVVMIYPEVFADDRGLFFESFNARTFADAVGREVAFVQDNHSVSERNVVRGLHYQLRHPQGKLVRVIAGEIFDVVVDVRRSSPTFGRSIGTVMNAESKAQIWIPAGFVRTRGSALQNDGFLRARRRDHDHVERSDVGHRVAAQRRRAALAEGSARHPF